MECDACATAWRVISHYNEQGFVQQSQWQEFNLGVDVNTYGWATTVQNPKTGERLTLILPRQLDQCMVFDWKDAKSLGIFQPE